MAVTAETLETLHRIHRQLGDLRDRLDRGPRQVRAREANVVKLEAELAVAQEAVKQATRVQATASSSISRPASSGSPTGR